jgi:hypothetical protein
MGYLPVYNMPVQRVRMFPAFGIVAVADRPEHRGIGRVQVGEAAA